MSQHSIIQTEDLDGLKAVSSHQLAMVVLGMGPGDRPAVREILCQLPAGAPLVVVVAQGCDALQEPADPAAILRGCALRARPVQQAVAIEPGAIYLLPPDRCFELRGGLLTPLKHSPGADTQVFDALFCSAAEEYGPLATGLLFSRECADGVHGLRQIRARGGFALLASRPPSGDSEPPARAGAWFDLASVWADLTLSPDRMADEILRLTSHAAHGRSGGPTVGNDFIANIGQRLQAANRAAHVPDEGRVLKECVLRRMALAQCGLPELYLKLLRDDSTELHSLWRDVSMRCSGFFRENQALEALKQRVFPALFGHRSAEDPVRVWAPGCAFGEEAYSLAVCLLEFMAETDAKAPIQIFATDLGEFAMERSRIGEYRDAALGGISSERMKAFFRRIERGAQIAFAARRLFVFAQHDLLRDPPFSNIDLVIYRNQLLHLPRPLRARALKTIHFALRPGGFLVLGPTETPEDEAPRFTQHDPGLKIYRRKEGPEGALGTTPERGARHPADRVSADSPLAVEPSRFSLRGVLLDEEWSVIRIYGDVSAYLATPAEVGQKFSRALRGDLFSEFSRTFHLARGSEVTVQSGIIAGRRLGKLVNALMTITPIAIGPGDRQYLMLFEEAQPGGGKTAAAEEDLEASKHYLEAVIEEHLATTEELRNANEQLQRSNEELQSADREMRGRWHHSPCVQSQASRRSRALAPLVPVYWSPRRC